MHPFGTWYTSCAWQATKINLGISTDNHFQLFQNFIQNAIKYRNKKVPIVIELDYITSEQKITIKDNGIGIDVEDTEILFEVYHQQKFELVKEGVGIGLYIAKMIVALHRIKIKIHSKVNERTTIELYFNEDVIQD